MNFTPMMEEVGEAWKFWNLNWPPSDEFPGEDSRFENCETAADAAGVCETAAEPGDGLSGRKEGPTSDPGEPVSRGYGAYLQRGGSDAGTAGRGGARGAHTALHCITAFADMLSRCALHREMHLELAEWIKDFQCELLLMWSSHQLEGNDELRRFFIIIDTGLSTVAGMIEDEVLRRAFWRSRSTT